MVKGLAKPILDKLLDRTEITMQEKADFSMFLATLRVRIPDFKKRTEEGGEKMYKKFNKFTFSNREYVETIQIITRIREPVEKRSWVACNPVSKFV